MTSPPTPASRRSFVSVRDTALSPRQCSFYHCLTTGYADDGGMFLPYQLPNLRDSDIVWSALTHQQTLTAILSLLIDDAEIPHSQLSSIVDTAYQRFDGGGQPLRLQHFDRPLEGFNHRRCSVLELWHGPTLTFKDIALAPLAALLSHFTSENDSGRSLNVMVGTSGDTGSAAIEAVKSLPNIHLTVLYPHDRISPIQELQMIGVTSPNVTVVGVDGSSDDLDKPIKACFDDLEFKTKYNLCSINSINVVRILCQCAHIIYTVSAMKESRSDGVSLSIPSGAIGHLVAVVLCKRMGLAVDRVCVACNSNGVISHFIETGVYRPATRVTVTESCAIDIGQPYNIERLVYLLQPLHTTHQQRAQRVCEAMAAIEQDGEFQCNESERREIAALGLCGVSVSDRDTLAIIRSVYQSHKYVIDPHTAVAVYGAQRRLLDCPSPLVCLSTAHPAKFLESLVRATGHDERHWREIFANSEYENVRRLMALVDRGRPARLAVWAAGEDWKAKLMLLIADNDSQTTNTSQ